MQLIISKGAKEVVIPVNPESFEVTDGWNNQELDINQIGLVKMIGKRALKAVTISSFFPGQEYEFLDDDAHAGNPWWYVKRLAVWRGKVIHFATTGTKGVVSWTAVIDDFTYGYKDGTDDIYYSITLTEYKAMDVTREEKENAKVKYTTKQNDNLKTIAKKKLGKSSYAKKVYKQNKKAIDSALNKTYRKWVKTNKKLATEYRKKNVLTKALPKGINLTMKV